MCIFITKVIKVNREDYPPNTVKELVYCIQMFLHAKRVFWYLLDRSDVVFLDMYYVFVKSAMPVSVTTEKKLWQQGKLWEENGTQLVQTVMFLLGINVRLRGGLEHKRLCRPGFLPQFNLTVDEDGFKCLQLTENPKTENHQGGVSVRPRIPEVVNIYPNFDNMDRCPVHFYEKYISLLPTTKCNGILYMHAKKKPSAKCWFLDYPLGINTITPLVKELVGVTEGNDRNQSLRATRATLMYNQGQDEQLIHEFMVHKSNSVRRYKLTSDVIKHKASRIIQGAKKCVVAKFSQNKSKWFKIVKKVAAKHSKVHTETNDTGSDKEFMPSQNLRTYKGNAINDGVKIVKNCENVVQGPSDSLCSMLSEITKGKFKKIKVNIEIVNSTDSD